MSNWPRNRRRHPLDRQRGYVPTPIAVVMEDRATGTLYLLSHDSDTPVLTTPVPAQVHAITREPVLQTDFGPARLYVSDAILHLELIDEQVQDGPVFTLNFDERRTTYEVYGAAALDTLCLRKYTGVGRTVQIEDLGCTFFINALYEELQDSAGEQILDSAGNTILIAVTV